MVYSHDVDRGIAGAEDLVKTWESLNLSDDQKLYRLIFSYSVLNQLVLCTQERKQKADQDAMNTLRRQTRRDNKKAKEEEKEKENNEASS